MLCCLSSSCWVAPACFQPKTLLVLTGDTQCQEHMEGQCFDALWCNYAPGPHPNCKKQHLLSHNHLDHRSHMHRSAQVLTHAHAHFHGVHPFSRLASHAPARCGCHHSMCLRLNTCTSLRHPPAYPPNTTKLPLPACQQQLWWQRPLGLRVRGCSTSHVHCQPAAHAVLPSCCRAVLGAPHPLAGTPVLLPVAAAAGALLLQATLAVLSAAAVVVALHSGRESLVRTHLCSSKGAVTADPSKPPTTINEAGPHSQAAKSQTGNGQLPGTATLCTRQPLPSALLSSCTSSKLTSCSQLPPAATPPKTVRQPIKSVGYWDDASEAVCELLLPGCMAGSANVA
jgi:hypothetical protein